VPDTPTAASEPIQWQVAWRIDKYRADDRSAPYAVVEGSGNLLVYGGASALWQRLIGTGVTAFDNSNAYLGVGDDSTAAAATQTDLQAATNKHREAMDATYPLHTDGTGSSSNAVITYKSTFETGDANFTWSEWAIFNASSSGRMLNRKVFSGGTKTSAEAWSLTVSITLA
jgi:hypothetical protein